MAPLWADQMYAVLTGRLVVNVKFAGNGIGTELMEIIKFWFLEHGFSFLFKDDEQESVNSKLKLPLKTRYMYFD